MGKSILALDVSSVATGWAFGRPGEKPISGVHRFANKHALPDEVWFAALRWMTEKMGVHSPDVVAIEAPIVSSSMSGSTNAATQGMLWGLQAVLRTVVKAKLPGTAKLVNVSSARKFFTGRGAYEKDQAKPAVKRRCIQLGWIDEKATHDQCDALCIWAKAAGDIDKVFASEFTDLGTSNVVNLIPKNEVIF